MTDAHPRPRMIFFDVGDTLVRSRRPFEDVLVEAGREVDVDLPEEAGAGLGAHVNEQITQRTWQRQPYTFPAEASQQFWLETYRGYLARFVSDADALRLAFAVREALSSPAGYALYDDAVPALQRLQATGYRMGIISNWEAWLPTLLDALNISQYFDHVVISGACGVEKPDSRIFTLALEVSGYRADDIIYVGDRPEHDVVPALAVGITPILLDRSGTAPHADNNRTIATLSDLPTVLLRQ